MPIQLFVAPHGSDFAEPMSKTWQLNGGPASAGSARAISARTNDAITVFRMTTSYLELSVHCRLHVRQSEVEPRPSASHHRSSIFRSPPRMPSRVTPAG